MQFLLESIRKNRRKLRIEEMILLALRCLVILALAAAVARFNGCQAMDVLPGATGSRTCVFVLDDSYSMDQKVASTPIFRPAAADLIEQIEKLSKSDKVAIMLASSPDSAKPFYPLTHKDEIDMDSLTHRLAALKPSPRRVNWPDMLQASKAFYEGEKGKKRLTLLSDFRRDDLTAKNVSKEIGSRMKELESSGVELVMMDYGRESRDNLTVESIELLDKFALAEQEMRLRISVRNNSPKEVRNLKVVLSARFAGKLDGSPGGEVRKVSLPVQVINSIPAGASAKLECKVTPPWPGSMVVTVALQPDELAGDNHAHLALKIRRALNVLIVDGRPDFTDWKESESASLTTAIDPNSNGDSGITSKVVTVAGLAGENLNDYDLVALLDVSELAGMPGAAGKEINPLLKSLEGYVRGGGGLVIFTGDSVNMRFYNGPLYNQGRGLSPYRIGPKVGDPVGRKIYYQLDPKSISGEFVTREFYGERSICTTLVRFFAFTPARELLSNGKSAGSKPRVLARFNDPQSSPAMAIKSFGKGSVLMVYTTAGMKWNDWGADMPEGIYVGPMLDMVAYMSRPQVGRKGRGIGESIVFDLNEKTRDAKAILRTASYPKTEQISLVPQRKLNLMGEQILGELADQLISSADSMEKTAPKQAEKLRVKARAIRQALVKQNLAGIGQSLKDALQVIESVKKEQGDVDELRSMLQGRIQAGFDEFLGREMRYDRVNEAGVYSMLLKMPGGAGKTVFFARNTNPDEGNLTPGGKKAIVSVFGSDEFIYFQRSGTSAEANIKASAGREYWMWALAAMLVFLAAETVLAQKFGHYSKKQ